MKKLFAAILSVICVMLTSCEKSANEEVLIEITESENEFAVEEITAETVAESIESITEITETVSEKISETERNAEIFQISYEIQRLNFVHISNELSEPIFYDITPRNSRVFAAAESGGLGFVTDNQLKNLIDEINQTELITSDKTEFVLNISYSDGSELSLQLSEKTGSELSDMLADLCANSYSDEPSEGAVYGINKSVDVIVYYRSYLYKRNDLGEDCSAYTGCGKTIDSSNLNPENSDVGVLPNDWHGFAYVKFNADGTDVEYVNWSETEEGLSQKRLSYDDLEAYLIEYDTMIGSSE